MSGQDLSGVRVLVTRPAALGEPLCRRIVALGGEAFAFPAIGIEPLPLEKRWQSAAFVREFSVIVFTSRNAVAHGKALLSSAGQDLPALAAIGAGTARDLQALGYSVGIVPDGGYNSEALLRTPALREPAGESILIVRGQGGRKLLADTLEARGARVAHAVVYRRVAPDRAPAELLRRWRESGFDVVTAGSVETLQNLHRCLGPDGHNLLRSALLVTASERVVKEARALGVKPPPLLAAAPDDEALVAAILAWRDTATDSRGGYMSDDKSGDASKNAPHGPQSTEPAGGEPRYAPAVVAPEAEETSHTDIEDKTPPRPPPPATPRPPPPPPESAPRRSRGLGAGLLAALALLIALAALAGSAWLWQQQRGVGDDLGSARSSLLAASGAVDEALAAIQALANDVQQTSARVSKLEGSQRSIGDLRERLAADIGHNAAEIQRIETALASMRGLSDTVRQTWVRAETEYFLQSANTSLQMSRDAESALAALEAADDRLRSLADPALTDVRARLAEEIAAVRALPRADVQGLALSLGSLASRVDLLPMATGERAARFVDESERGVSGESRMQKALSALGGALKGLVSIQRRDGDIAPLLAPEERFFLYRNLELQLEIARLAALRRDSANYRESLRAARRWLEKHFDHEDSGVIGALETLVQLESAEINPPLPDISGSLRALRRSAPGGVE